MSRIRKTGKMMAILLSAVLAVQMVLPGSVAYAEAISEKTEEKDPLEDTVIVLMEDGSLMTEKKVRNALSEGEEAVDDITVEDMWTFEGGDASASVEAGQDGNAGLSLNGSSAGDDEAVVALVSSDSMSASKLARKLNKRKDVALAEKNVKVHALSVSYDAYSDFQWSMQSEENAPNVEYEWKEKGVTGTEKIVAILDSGVDYTHPDLKANMWVNTHRKIKGVHGYDFINGDGDPMDDNGHGTHCAGIIGAVGNNKEGISGVNQSVRIMALKCLDYEGSAWLSHEIAAYDYISKAIDLGEPVVAVNNSWGGGEGSSIFAKLVDIVGEKGAATVCSAGNDSADNDEEPGYPAGIDSQYLIDVAAVNREGSLASFSNYGESVDAAAPGTDILSTVSYDSYNPTIYGDAQDSISAEYNGFSDSSNTFGIPDKFYVNGDECEKSGSEFTGKDGQKIVLETVSQGFSEGDSHALKISYSGLKDDDMVSFTLPYQVEKDAWNAPWISLMCRMSAAGKTENGFSISTLVVTDLAEEDVPDLDTIGEMDLVGASIRQGEMDYWRHMKFSSGILPDEGETRKFAVGLYAARGGDYSVTIDDIGISRQDIDTKAFGKYDFMSGTSMAAPYITGAVALKAAEKEKQQGAKSVDITEVINEVTAMAKDEPEISVGPKGGFDFRRLPEVMPPRIARVTVDTAMDAVRISGAGLFADKPGFKVEIGPDDYDMRRARIIPGMGADDGSEVWVRNDHWINNLENVRVTGAGGRVSRRNNVYLVGGKEEYTLNKDLELELSEDASVTDGKKIYTLWPQSREIKVQDPTDTGGYSETLVTVEPSRLFTTEKEETVKYGMLMSGLAYANGKLYTVVEYGAADETESGDIFFWGLGSGSARRGIPKVRTDDEDEDDYEDEFENPISIYSGEYKLISVSASAKEDDMKYVDDLGGLPEELQDLENYTMASYNGKIYFIGGSRGYGESRELSGKVFVFDPAKGQWSDGAPLPEPRAGGKALQYGSALIYTLGEGPESTGEQEELDVLLPDNLIFDGTAWRACSVRNQLVKMYGVDEIDVSLTAKGLLYTGAPVWDYGDTFIYDVSENRYADTGYNYLRDPAEYGLMGIAVGGTFYGVSDEYAYTLPVESGLVKVSASRKGKGTIKGSGSYMPGNDAKITVKAAKKYYIKSLKVNGKKVKLGKKAAKKVYTIKKMTGGQKVKAVFAKKKKK